MRTLIENNVFGVLCVVPLLALFILQDAQGIISQTRRSGSYRLILGLLIVLFFFAIVSRFAVLSG